MTLLCALHRHEVADILLQNQGFAFSKCRRCRVDMIRSVRGGTSSRWQKVPRGFQVHWGASHEAMGQAMQRRSRLRAMGQFLSPAQHPALLAAILMGWSVADRLRRPRRSQERVTRLPAPLHPPVDHDHHLAATDCPVAGLADIRSRRGGVTQFLFVKLANFTWRVVRSCAVRNRLRLPAPQQPAETGIPATQPTRSSAMPAQAPVSVDPIRFSRTAFAAMMAENRRLVARRSMMEGDIFMPYIYCGNTDATGLADAVEAMRTLRGDHVPLATTIGDRKLAALFGGNLGAGLFDDFRRGSDGGGTMAINACAADFTGDDFAERLMAAMTMRDINPALMEVEVTEDVLAGATADMAMRALIRLSAAGVRIAIDGRDRGGASLDFLGQMPLAVMAMDRAASAAIRH